MDAVLSATAQIMEAYVGSRKHRNRITVNEAGDVLSAIGGSLIACQRDVEPEKTVQRAAVPIRKSIHDEYLICLEDGRKLRMLKRYLRTQYGLTPDEYRIKWGLPPEYPMICPSYSEWRSKYARSIGLGKKVRPPTDHK